MSSKHMKWCIMGPYAIPVDNEGKPYGYAFDTIGRKYDMVWPGQAEGRAYTKGAYANHYYTEGDLEFREVQE